MSSVPYLLLTGPPRVGKTTVVCELVDRLSAADRRVGGFLTAEVREAGRRVGFTVAEIGGAGELMAHVGWTEGPRVGRYRVDVPAFERVALPALDRATETAEVIVMDELGRMELYSAAFVARLDELFAGRLPLVATVQAASHPVTDALKRRGGVEVVTVTGTNRSTLAARLAARLGAGR